MICNVAPVPCKRNVQMSPSHNLEMSPLVLDALRWGGIAREGRCNGGDDESGGGGPAFGDAPRPAGKRSALRSTVWICAGSAVTRAV